jgi:sec-independent protein translocase protein TatA
MGGLGMRELVIILLVVLVVFGAKKLRNVGSDLGHAVRGFKKAMSDGEEEQSSAPKQLPPQGVPPEGADAEFPEVAKKSDTKTERST